MDPDRDEHFSSSVFIIGIFENEVSPKKFAFSMAVYLDWEAFMC